MPSLADRFRDHASRMQGLYRTLLYEMAADWDARGVVREICRDWADAPANAVVQLRLLAGVQRLVLRRQAPELALFYPNLGGTADPSGAWPVFRRVLSEHVDELREALHAAPQTNEPGRSAPLLVGIFDAVRRSGRHRVRLLEPGASAGLNLLVDRFRIGGSEPELWWSGPADSPLRLGSAVIGGIEPVDYTIVARRGCDVAPVDPGTEEGRLRLTSFVWPHHVERYQRLQAALRVAAEHPVPVDQADAADWLAGQLADPADESVLTVVWHSVTSQYWAPAEIRRVGELIADAGSRLPIAHIAMENPPGAEFQPAELTVALYPGDTARTAVRRRLAVVADHGVPVTLRG